MPDEVIAVSEMVKKDAKRYYGVDAEVHPNAVSRFFKDQVDLDARASRGIRNNLLMVGNFEKRKGFHLIPEILNEFSKNNL